MADGREATGAGRTTAMALSGGIALGAYHAGACAALHEEGGGDLRLDWLAGASIGAVTAAIVAGNPPGRRVERLRRFWDAAAAGLAPPGPPLARRAGAGRAVAAAPRRPRALPPPHS